MYNSFVHGQVAVYMLSWYGVRMFWCFASGGVCRGGRRQLAPADEATATAIPDAVKQREAAAQASGGIMLVVGSLPNRQEDVMRGGIHSCASMR